MASMPIQNPVVAPSVIRDLPPGDIPDALLFEVDDHSRGVRDNRMWLMAELPARAMRALHAECLDHGILLSSTGRTRSFAQQYDLFLSRHDPVTQAVYNTLPAQGGQRRLWPEAVTTFHLASQWWRLRPGVAAAAIPSYTAPHVLGCADDTAEVVNGTLVGLRPATVQWLYGVAPLFGFRWSLTAEPWHLQWVAGDTLPPAVVFYEAGLGVHPAPTETLSQPTPGTEADDMPITILRSLTTPPEFYAQFVAYTDMVGHSIEVQWSGPGDDPKCARRMADLRAAGIPDAHITLAGLRNNVLHPRHKPSDITDGLRTWSADDFA